MTCKEVVRKSFLDKRRALSEERRQAARRGLLEMLYPKLRSFTKVLAFASKKEEIDLGPLNALLAKEGRLLFPRLVQDVEILPFCVKDLEKELTLHPKWKVWEPHPQLCTPVSLDEVSCVLVPGVGFDTFHQRIGYGKGCYDRFLSQLSCPFYGVGFREQLFAGSLPVESHDIPLTETFLF